jgi:hypothetical protein
MVLRAVLLVPLAVTRVAGQDLPIPAPGSRYDAEPPNVRIWLNDDRPYHWGEPIRVFFRTDIDAFVSVVAVDAVGRVQIVFPRSPRDNAAVMGGTSYYVDTRSNSVFNASGSSGTGYVFAIASSEPLDLSAYEQRRAWRYTYVNDYRIQSAPQQAIAKFASDVLFDARSDYSYDLAYVYVRSSRIFASRFCYADAPLCRDYWNSGYRGYSSLCYSAFSFYTYLFNDCFLYGSYYRPYIPRPVVPTSPQPPSTGRPLPRRPIVVSGGWRPDTVSITMPDPSKPGDPGTGEGTPPANRTEPPEIGRQRRPVTGDAATRRPVLGEPFVRADNPQRPRNALREGAVRQPAIEPRAPSAPNAYGRRPTIENGRRPDSYQPPQSAPRSDPPTRFRPDNGWTAPRGSPSGGGGYAPIAPSHFNDGSGSSPAPIDRSATSRPAPAAAPAPTSTEVRRDPAPARSPTPVKPDIKP